MNNGYEFEEYIAHLLRVNGYEKVSVTRKSGDFGVDIVAQKGKSRCAIQCKMYSALVGNKAIQEVYAGKMYYKCDISIVVTNSYFTDAAIDLAKSTGTILWDYDDLVKLEKQAILDSKKKQRDPCLYNNERATCDDDERSELFWSEDEY